MISQTAEYALRAVTCLASQHDKAMTTQQIADVGHIPVGYLSKVLQSLSRGGLVQAFRGIHGGFVLRRPPSEISVLDVVQAVDPLQRIRTCPLDLKSHAKQLCPLHQRLDDAMRMVEEAFGRTTIGELLEGGEAAFPVPLVDTETDHPEQHP